MYEVALNIILKGDTYITFKYYNNYIIFINNCSISLLTVIHYDCRGKGTYSKIV